MHDLPRLRISRLRRRSGTFRKSTISLNQFHEQYNLVTRKKGAAKLDHSIWSVGIRGKMIAVGEGDRIFSEGMFNIRCNIPYSDFTFGKICENARSSSRSRWKYSLPSSSDRFYQNDRKLCVGLLLQCDDTTLYVTMTLAI